MEDQKLLAPDTYTIAEIPNTTATVTDSYLFEDQAGAGGQSEKVTASTMATYFKSKLSGGTGISYNPTSGVISSTADLQEAYDTGADGEIILGSAKPFAVNTASESVAVNDSTTSAQTLFEVNSTTRASRPAPRMTAAQRDAIASPENGSIVFVTDTDTFYIYNGEWSPIAIGAPADFLLSENNLSDVDSVITSLVNLGIPVTASQSFLDTNLVLGNPPPAVVYGKNSGLGGYVQLPSAQGAGSLQIGQGIVITLLRPSEPVQVKDSDGTTLLTLNEGISVSLILDDKSTSAGAWQYGSLYPDMQEGNVLMGNGSHTMQIGSIVGANGITTNATVPGIISIQGDPTATMNLGNVNLVDLAPSAIVGTDAFNTLESLSINPTNISLAGGTLNTTQNISSSSSPTFASLLLTGGLTSTGQPARVMTSVSATQSIANNTETSMNIWDTDLINQGGAISHSAGVFTISAPGLYAISVALSFPANSTGIREIWLSIDSGVNIYGYNSVNAVASGIPTRMITGFLLLPVIINTTVQVRAYQTSGVALGCGGGNLDSANQTISIVKLF